MNEMLNTLYGFDELGFGTPGSHFGWAVPIPGWAWLLIAIGAVSIAVSVYARARLSRPLRIVTGALRTVLLLLLVTLALGPRLERPRTRVEPDRVLYLVDRSASMSIADAAGVSRDAQLRGSLGDHASVFAGIAETKDTRWYAFGGPAVALGSGDGPTPALPDADASTTRLGAAFADVLAQNAGHPVSAVVVLSDGRSADTLSAATLAALRADRVPVISVPIGSASQVADLAVTAATAPGIAFVDDTVPVTVLLTAGDAGGGDDLEGGRLSGAASGRIDVIESGTGLTLESREVTSAEIAEGRVTVPVRMDRAGEQRWTVRYVPDGPDLSPANNETSLAVRFVDDPIRVLYLDGSPRWEHRYLKSLLIREDSIDASCLLLAADRRFQQEGNTVLTSLPTAEEDWDAFDLVIIGDLKADLLGERAIRAIRDRVGQRASGLLWLAGPSATPRSWAGTDLADLLPVRATWQSTGQGGWQGGSQGSGLAVWDEPVVFGITPVAERLGLFQDLLGVGTGGGAATGIADPSSGWSGLRWALRIGPDSIKPSAEPLAMGVPTQSDAPQTPLVLGMRYGAGRTAMVASDEIWRWRYGRGEPPTERFWLPLIRHLARPRLAALGSGVSLTVSSPVVTVSQRVVIELTIDDRSIAEISPRTLDVRILPVGNPAATSQTVRLVRDAPEGSGPTRYRGAFTPLRTGPFDVRLAERGSLPAEPTAQIEVISVNDELRSPQTDHAALGALAAQTEGRVIQPVALADLPGALPNRRVIVPLLPETRTLWDHPAPLTLLVLIAACEWIIRRRSRLP